MYTIKILISTALLPLSVLAQHVPAAEYKKPEVKEQKKVYPKIVSHSPQVVIYLL